MKFKMAAMAGLSLTLDPMGKMFQNASSLKPLGQLKPNCPGMIIGRFSTTRLFFMPFLNPRWTIETKLPRNDHWRSSTKLFYFHADRKSKMATTAGHRLALDPMGKCSNAFFSETTNMIKAKLYMNVHWMVFYKF
jgi:hypothetical protein